MMMRVLVASGSSVRRSRWLVGLLFYVVVGVSMSSSSSASVAGMVKWL